MTERSGQQLGNYRLVRRLGRGGAAEVYLGEHIFLKTQAAIKVLLSSLSQQDMPAFLREARLIAGLAHPNIIRVLDFGVHDETFFLVMEYAPNGTLRRRYPGGVPQNPASIAPLVRQIADALQYAHDLHIIHCDIKPENMLLGKDNRVLLSDFGISIVLQTLSTQQAHEIVGTIAYMAPEQFEGKPQRASDQYSLAVAAYEWLGGERPFQGSLAAVSNQHLSALPPLLSEKIPGFAPEIDEVLRTAMAKDPGQRFSSMQAFARAFEQACGVSPASFAVPIAPGSGVTTQPDLSSLLNASPWSPTVPNESAVPGGQSAALPWSPTVPDKSAAPANQGQSGVDVTLAPRPLPRVETINPYPPELALLAGPSLPPSGGIVASPPSQPGMPAGSSQFSQGVSAYPVQQVASTKSQGVSRRALLAGLGGAVAVGALATLALSGKLSFLLVNQIGPGSATPTHNPAKRAEPTHTPTPTPSVPVGTTLLVYTGHSDQVTDVSWSPAVALTVASSSMDQSVTIWNASAGNTEQRHQQDGQLYALAWSPDGRYLASAGSSATIEVWDTMTNQVVATCTGHTQSIFGLAWSPDGRRIVSASQDHTAQVWNPLTGTPLVSFTGHVDTVWVVEWSPNGRSIASGSVDGTVQIWNPNSAARTQIYTASSAVRALAWSPDGRSLASGGDNAIVQVWQVATAGVFATYRGHQSVVEAVQWSRDGSRVASASKDHTVQIWQATTASQIYTYTGHSNLVWTLAWSPDDRLIASGGADKTVRVWQAG